MEVWVQAVITIACAIAASSGFWAYIQSKNNKKSAEKDLLLGLAHDRIMSLGEKFLERGWLTHDEYENFYEYLYKPYEKMGGNGSAKHMLERVNKLPIHKSNYFVKGELSNATVK